jgi:hypothetical protein
LKRENATLQDEQAPATAKEKRVEKKHRVRGHDYTARHFHTVQICDHCRNPMFGLGKQGYICRSMRAAPGFGFVAMGILATAG